MFALVRVRGYSGFRYWDLVYTIQSQHRQLDSERLSEYHTRQRGAWTRHEGKRLGEVTQRLHEELQLLHQAITQDDSGITISTWQCHESLTPAKIWARGNRKKFPPASNSQKKTKNRATRDSHRNKKKRKKLKLKLFTHSLTHSYVIICGKAAPSPPRG